MADRSGRKVWQCVAAGCCLVWAITSLAGATAESQTARPVEDTRRPSLRTLQLNLCNSGIAGCYTGRSVSAAVELIRTQRPDIVTLNEVCRDDVSVLERALSRPNRAEPVASAFKPALDRRAGGVVRCRNGQPYGVGLLARVRSSSHGYRSYGGVYPIQDAGDVERRIWLCVHSVGDFYACTTHLASTSAVIALAQCRYLLNTAIPGMRTEGGPDPMVLGADLNLSAGGLSDAKSCLPSGYVRADDGARQHVVGTPGFTVKSSRSISMHGTTDHPALLVDLAIGA
jgi:endonuclease/exonuclease/phosphatase family metal-dependent hydrolase